MVQFIEKTIETTGAEIIFTHHPSDLNIDHQKTSMACQAAARLFQRKSGVTRLSGLYYMEVPSSTDWKFPNNQTPFAPNTFIELKDVFLEKKLSALACYKNVMRPFPHPRSHELIRSLATIRGSQSGLDFAEAFECAFQNSEHLFLHGHK